MKSIPWWLMGLFNIYLYIPLLVIPQNSKMFCKDKSGEPHDVFFFVCSMSKVLGSIGTGHV